MPTNELSNTPTPDEILSDLLSGKLARQIEAKSEVAQAYLQEALDQLHALLDEVETEPINPPEIAAVR